MPSGLIHSAIITTISPSGPREDKQLVMIMRKRHWSDPKKKHNGTGSLQLHETHLQLADLNVFPDYDLTLIFIFAIFKPWHINHHVKREQFFFYIIK